jgi:hypothetical protein
MGYAQDYHDFAMLIQVSPGRDGEWHQLLKTAKPEEGVCVEVRSPNLVIFACSADTEMDAIERAEQWLSSLAKKANPPISLAFHARTSGVI